MNQKKFMDSIRNIALPVTIQCLFQAMLGLIDQLMIGHLGSSCIAGVGLGGKFISLFTVTVSAIVTVAGILIAQYIGKEDRDGIRRSFHSCMYIAMIVGIIFLVLSIIIPNQIMGLYSNDKGTIRQAGIYLRIMSAGFIPQIIALMFSTLLRNMEAAKYVMYASGLSVISNTILNYLFIFGVGFMPRMDVAGAALATSLARIIEMAVVVIMYFRIKNKSKVFRGFYLSFGCRITKDFVKKIAKIIAPILLCEFLWSLGENVYAVIYGHIGTDSVAAMTLTYPIQTLAIGALSGVSAAAGIIIGQSLGVKKYEKAYEDSKKIMKLTIFAAVAICIFVSVIANLYVNLYNVNDNVKNITVHILYAYSLVFCAKVVNMVLGGGILRSGGQTKYIMIVDIVGTWLIGVPLGLLTSFVLGLPIYIVYFILSLEEYVRMLMEIYLFKSEKWMKNISNE